MYNKQPHRQLVAGFVPGCQPAPKQCHRSLRQASGHHQAAHEGHDCVKNRMFHYACGVMCLDWLTSLPWINTASRVRLAKARGDKVGFRDAAACKSCAVHAMPVIQSLSAACCWTGHARPHACHSVQLYHICKQGVCFADSGQLTHCTMSRMQAHNRRHARKQALVQIC